MQKIQIDDIHTGEITASNGMRIMRVHTRHSLAEEDDGKLPESAKQLVERAHAARGDCERIDIIRVPTV